MGRVPELRFPEFSGEWREVKLGEIGSFKSGTGFPEREQGGKEGIPFFKVSDMNLEENTVEMKYANNYVSDEQVARLKFKPIIEPSIIFAKVGAAIFLERKRLAKNFLIDNNMMAFIPHVEYNYHFIRYLFDIIRLSKYAQVGALPSYNASDLKIIKIKLPSLPEQQKIADFLSAVDEKITLSQEKITRLEAYKKGMMQKLLSGEVRFHGFTDAWEYKSLEAYINLITGFPFKSSEILEEDTGVPLLRGINITEGYIRHSPEIDRFYGKNIDEKIGKYIVKENDLVLAMDGSKVGKNVALVDNKNSGTLLVQRVARIRAKKYADIRYIYQNIFSDTFRKYVDVVNTSSGIPHISSKQINEFTMWFPSIKEQQKIADSLTAIDDKLTFEKERLEALKRYKHGLLQKMFV